MGDNRDLTWELGLPKEVKCIQCGKTIDTQYDDYDVDCGSPNLKRGVWVLRNWCPDCFVTWFETFELNPKKIHSEIIKSV